MLLSVQDFVDALSKAVINTTEAPVVSPQYIYNPETKLSDPSIIPNINPKPIIIVFSPTSYIYASNGLTAYSHINKENLKHKYDEAMAIYNKWKYQFDKVKNATDQSKIESRKFFEKKMNIAMTGFVNYREDFITELVSVILERFDSIYIERAPSLEISDSFRGIKYIDQTECFNLLKINNYDSVIREFQEQIRLINDNFDLKGAIKHLYTLPEELTIKAHKRCSNCNSELTDRNFISSSYQLVSCPYCGKLLNEYENMMKNIQNELKILKITTDYTK